MLDVRRYVLTFALAAIFSFFLVAGFYADNNFEVDALPIIVVLGCIALLAILYFALILLWRILDRTTINKGPRNPLTRFVEKHCRSWRFFFLTQGAILICWLPIWLAAYPGFYCYDTEALASFAEGNYNINHSLLYTFIASKVIYGCAELFGSVNTGVAIFTALSALIVSATLTSALRFIAVSGSYAIAIGGFLFYALDPIVSMFSICTTKDVFSSAAFVQLLLLVLAVEKNPSLLEKKGRGGGMHSVSDTRFSLLLLSQQFNNRFSYFVPSPPLLSC